MAQPPPPFVDPLFKDKYTVPGHPAPNSTDDASFVIYGYVPALSLSVLAVVWFGLLFIAALALSFRLGTRCCGGCFRWDTLFFLVYFGLAVEVVGYIFRILSHTQDPYNINDFVVQYFLIVVAPIFFSAAIYLALCRLIVVAGRQISPLPPRAILWIFIVADVVTIAVQVAGAGWLGANESNAEGSQVPDISAPTDVLIAGLAIQTFTFAVFFLIYALVCRNLARMRAQTLPEQLEEKRGFHSTAVKMLWLLGAVAFLVELRTVFRLVEACVGFFGYLEQREAFFGALEFAPIAVAVVGLLPVGSLTRRLMAHGNAHFMTANAAAGEPAPA